MNDMTNREIAHALVRAAYGSQADLINMIVKALDAKDRVAAQKAVDVPYLGRVS